MPLIDASLVLRNPTYTVPPLFILAPASPPGARWAGSLPCAMIGDRSLVRGGLAWIAPGELQLDLAQDSNHFCANGGPDTLR